MSSFAELRRMMVDCQLRTYDITDKAVLAAAGRVPRELFLGSAPAHLAYLDQPVPLPGTGRALLAPMTIARMIQALDLQPGDTALEYGGGSGYGAALMAAMAAEVTFYEPDEAALAIARGAIAAAGLAVTLTSEAPAATFAAILVSGSCERKPAVLFPLLRDGGRLVVVEGGGRSGRVVHYRRAGESVSARPVFDSAAPALDEFRKLPEFSF